MLFTGSFTVLQKLVRSAATIDANNLLSGIYVCLQIREKEANLDLLIMPIDDMYALLARCALWTKMQLS